MLALKKLSDGFGVEAEGIDLASSLTDAAFNEIEQRILRRPGARVSRPAPDAFAVPRICAALRSARAAHHRPVPSSRVRRHPDPVERDQAMGVPTGLADAGTYFHTDYSYLDVPARCTMLYSIVVPKVGGDTLFANQYAAYDDLSATMKARIENLVGLHHYGNRDDLNEASRTVASVLNDEQKNKMNWVRHRIARAHPLTGRKALYAVSGSSFGIEGMADDEAVALLDELKAHATQPKYLYRLKYRVGDLVIWDNASLLHSATLIDPNDARTLWRITVKEPLLST